MAGRIKKASSAAQHEGERRDEADRHFPPGSHAALLGNYKLCEWRVLFRDAGGVERKDRAAGEEREKIEIAGENVFARDIELDEEFGRNAELDGREFEEAKNVFVKRRWRQLGDEVVTIGDAERVGHELVVLVGEGDVAGERAGVGVRDGLTERRVSGDIEREKRGERASEAMAADGERGDGLLPGKPGEGFAERGRTRDGPDGERVVHGGEAVFGVASAGEEWAVNEKKASVVDPFEDALSAADGDDGVSRGGLKNEPHGNQNLRAQGRDVGGKVVGVD